LSGCGEPVFSLGVVAVLLQDHYMFTPIAAQPQLGCTCRSAS
jgi:hypothetical protein